MASQLKGMGFEVMIANTSEDSGVPLEDAQFVVANAPEEEEDPMGDDGFGDMMEFSAPTPEADRDIDGWAAAREEKGENRQFGYRNLPGRPVKGTEKSRAN